MTLYTNRIHWEFYLDRIAQDFAFICFQRQAPEGKPANWVGAPQLDKLLQRGMQAPDAVLYTYSKYAYAMFRRPVDISALIQEFRYGDFDEAAVSEAFPAYKPEDLPGQSVICGAWLVQILLNSLASSRTRYKTKHYDNLTGRLYRLPEIPEGDHDYIDAFEVEVRKDQVLQIPLKRFVKRSEALWGLKGEKRNKLLADPAYRWQAERNSLVRCFEASDEDREVYVQRQYFKTRARASFMHVGDIDSFEASRVGHFAQLLQDIEQHLGDYLKLELQAQTERTSTAFRFKELKPEKLLPHLNSRLLCVVDKVQNANSRQMITDFDHWLRKCKLNLELRHIPTPSPEYPNLVLVHPKEFYDKHSSQTNIQDPYQSGDELCLVQHWVERFSTQGKAKPKVSDAEMLTLLKELIIKQEIRQRKLNQFAWAQQKTGGVWQFLLPPRTRKDEVAYLMKVFPDGSFDLDCIGNDLFSPEQQTYQRRLDQAEQLRKRNQNEQLEGLIISPEGDINAIFVTEMFTLPDPVRIHQIMAEIKAPLPSELSTGPQLADFLESLDLQILEKNQKTWPAWLQDLRQQEMIDRNQLRKGLTNALEPKSLAARTVRQTLEQDRDVLLRFPKRQVYLREVVTGLIDIHYWTCSPEEIAYVVGIRPGKLQEEFTTGHRVRLLRRIEGGLAIDALLPLLDVAFVRTNQPTVLPFPFKYLREYRQQQQHFFEPVTP